MKMRLFKRSPEGKYSRDRIRTLLQAVHVLEHGPALWEVRTLGEKGASKRFESKTAAVEYAVHLRPDSEVIVHHQTPRKVTVARMEKSARNGASVRERVLRQ